MVLGLYYITKKSRKEKIKGEGLVFYSGRANIAYNEAKSRPSCHIKVKVNDMVKSNCLIGHCGRVIFNQYVPEKLVYK